MAFYRQLGDMVMTSFQPAIHTTNDVVRLAIIPLTASSCSSYAELINQKAQVAAQDLHRKCEDVQENQIMFSQRISACCIISVCMRSEQTRTYTCAGKQAYAEAHGHMRVTCIE